MSLARGDGKGPLKPVIAKPAEAKPAGPPPRRPVAQMLTSATGPKKDGEPLPRRSAGAQTPRAAEPSEDARTTVFVKPPVGPVGPSAPATDTTSAPASPPPVPSAPATAAPDTASGPASPPAAPVVAPAPAPTAAPATTATPAAAPTPAPAAPATTTAPAPEPVRVSTPRKVHVHKPGDVVPLTCDFWLEYVALSGTNTLECNVTRRDASPVKVELQLGTPAQAMMNTSEGVIEVKLTYVETTAQGSKEIDTEVFGASTLADKLSMGAATTARNALSRLGKVWHFLPDMILGAFAAATAIYASTVSWVREKPWYVAATFIVSAIGLAAVALWSGRQRKKELDS